MVPALTIKEIEKYCSYHYEYDEKRIIGIMIARYSIPQSQDMIQQQYDFWNRKTGHYLNVYWLGYGAYFFQTNKVNFSSETTEMNPVYILILMCLLMR